MHDGQYAESGHYYSFIYDRATHNWFRFNDHSVTMETETTVLEEAFGGPNTTKCAYSLIYINQRMATQLEQLPLQTYSNQADVRSGLCLPLKKHVADTNMKFEKDLSEYQVEKIGKTIVEKNKSRFETVK